MNRRELIVGAIAAAAVPALPTLATSALYDPTPVLYYFSNRIFYVNRGYGFIEMSALPNATSWNLE